MMHEYLRRILAAESVLRDLELLQGGDLFTDRCPA
jgi:hypothetical protein